MGMWPIGFGSSVPKVVEKTLPGLFVRDDPVILLNVDESAKNDQGQNDENDQIPHQESGVMIKVHHQTHGIDRDDHGEEETVEQELYEISGIGPGP